jgi:2'-5' RNA ligase superfamily
VSRLVARLSAWIRPASLLIVPVPAAEPAVAAWLGQERVEFDGVPLHVTVMYPFLPARSVDRAQEEAVAELARGVSPFPFTLTMLGRFPGVQYLAPEPAGAFAALTELIQHRWPSCRPYGGAYDTVIPHVTVAIGDSPPADPAALERQLPISGTADELWLLDQTSRGWVTRRRFPLGGA